MRKGSASSGWLAAGGWRLAAGGWWLVAGGWWLVAGGWWLALGRVVTSLRSRRVSFP
ncbi:hypothetical protein [Pandoraea eparura]|uniref:hypothetical protein n=1 Tax=Pandoraea eparura TaxID=2508291 RepID=UPI00158367F5|nr:hypothetical protein [Pandoraea eparura]